MKTKEIITKLRACQILMVETAQEIREIEDIKILEVMKDHALQLHGAGLMLSTWVDGIEEMDGGENNPIL